MVKCRYVKLAHLNVRSVFTKFDVFKAYLISESVDVFAVSETWLNEGDDPEEYGVDRLAEVPDYKLVRADRQGRGGGVGFYIRNSMPYKVMLSEVTLALEHLWVSIKIEGKNTAVGVLYRPPKANLIQSLETLDNAVSFILPSSDDLILVGDFNVNLLETDSVGVKHFNHFIESYGLNQLIDQPTRITNRSQTLLDILVVSNLSIASNCRVTDSLGVSDHCVVSCTIRSLKIPITPRFITYRDFKHFDTNAFEESLSYFNWDHIYTLTSVDEMLEFLNCNLLALFDIHAPIRIVRATKQRAPWLTDTIRDMIGLKEKALDRYRKSKTMANWNSFKDLRNYITGAIRREKRAYITHAVKLKDSKSLWSTLRSLEIVGRSSQNGELPDSLRDVDAVNAHFANVVIPNPTSSQQRLLMGYQPGVSKFRFSAVDTDAVRASIARIKSNCTGSDHISITMIKMVAHRLLGHITHIINAAISSSTFPGMWKNSLITPLSKVSDPAEFAHLRPISILPTMSKILERVLHTQMLGYVIGSDIVPEMQSGFRPHHSTTTALLHITDKLMRSVDIGDVSCLVLLDYSKAFDTVSHSLLCRKLSYFGFDDSAVAIIASFLADRSQRVRIGDDLSVPLPVLHGVPQGSILSPLLFSIYISDFHTHLQHCNVHHYADDTQVYLSFRLDGCVSASEKITEDLGRLVDVSTAHRLRLNASKSQAIVFGAKNKRIVAKSLLDIRIGDIPLQFATECKNLGLWLDEELRFTKHVNYLSQCCYLTLKQLYPHRDIMPSDLKLKLCNSLILSKLSYGDSIYGPALLKVDSDRLQRIQNSCVRFSCGIRKYQRGVAGKMKEIGWLRLHDIRTMHILNITHGVLKNNAPMYLSTKLRKLHRSEHNVRRPDLLEIPRHFTTIYTRSYTYNACREYNALPPEFSHFSITNFKKRLKIHFINRRTEF